MNVSIWWEYLGLIMESTLMRWLLRANVLGGISWSGRVRCPSEPSDCQDNIHSHDTYLP